MRRLIDQKYIQDIKAHFQDKQGVDYVIVFGSAVRDLRPDSDIDILVGARLNFQQKVNSALSLEQQVGRKVDVVCIDDAECTLALEAFAKGMPVVLNDRQRLKRDYLRKFREYEDNIPLRYIREAKLKRDLLRH